MRLDVERMEGYGDYTVDNYRVNYLFGLNDICHKYIKNNFTILELGVNNGVSTQLFCNYSKNVSGVDIKKTDRFENMLLNNKNLKFYNMSFVDFFNINTEKYDFIYIDGSHKYEDVKSDILNCLKILKKNGILSGHDYNSTCPGVIKAVDEIFGDVEVFDDSSWLKKI